MSRYIPIQEHLSHADGRMVIKINIDREAFALLRSWAPSKKSYGEFISRIIYENQIRREEREKLIARLSAEAASGMPEPAPGVTRG